MYYILVNVLNNANAFVTLWFYNTFMPYKKKYEQKKLLVGVVMFVGLFAITALRDAPFFIGTAWFFVFVALYFVFQFSIMYVVFNAPLWQKILIFFAHKVFESLMISMFDKTVLSFVPELVPIYVGKNLVYNKYLALWYAYSFITVLVLSALFIFTYRLIAKKERLLSERMFFILIPVSQLFLFVEASYVAAR